MPALDELELWVAEQRKMWIKKMIKENPDHAKYYCSVHGNYVGHNDFAPCKTCLKEKEI